MILQKLNVCVEAQITYSNSQHVVAPSVRVESRYAVTVEQREHEGDEQVGCDTQQRSYHSRSFETKS